jgi:soluble lytic murein transglycosylase-like protein
VQVPTVYNLVHRLTATALGLWLLVSATAALAQGGSKPRQLQPSPEVKRCLQAAAAKYGLDFHLLKAIARVESGFNPRAVRRPFTAGGNGTTDYGLMQINSTWLPTLKRWGISQEDLFDPCVSADVGAWVLRSNFNSLGTSWNAVGAYNAVSHDKRKVYAWRVYRALQQIQQTASIAPNQKVQTPEPTAAQQVSATTASEARPSSFIEFRQEIAQGAQP